MELIPAPWTDEEVVLRTQALMTALGQEPIRTTREIPGFVLNRLQGALLNEAFKLVQDGIVSVEDVDKTIREGLGLRWAFMGPFETIDLNAPGGISDYIHRYGPMYYEMAQTQSKPREWDDEIHQPNRASAPFAAARRPVAGPAGVARPPLDGAGRSQGAGQQDDYGIRITEEGSLAGSIRLGQFPLGLESCAGQLKPGLPSQRGHPHPECERIGQHHGLPAGTPGIWPETTAWRGC